MPDQPSIRKGESGDVERIQELVESSMTTSYALSPQDIETIIDAAFSESALEDRIDNEETIVLVGEVDDVLAGVTEATISDDTAEIQWLHVDPERRGAGLGSALFERLTAELEERGIDEFRAVSLAANTSAGTFFERFDYEKVDERQTDLGGRETIEYIYTHGDHASETSTDSAEPVADSLDDEYPETITTEDGEELYLGDDPFQGSEGLFTATFSDPDRSERYGFYCLHCGSADVSMDELERVRCGTCGNTRKPDDDYDGSYL
ncbi:GNAT family N-acetyltransferase [Halorussus halophilus]|uniref:GNAT family N-acetyltransferase n=1 Tax=Halorussus halophilus TaxID=2650975 RepID=UPI001300DB92|nr:GNAT family N-acetyltransferase [Halorussus halophilus]